MVRISFTLNGKAVEMNVPEHITLATLLRDYQKLTGTHIGCDSAQCGACTILKDGKSVKSCTLLAGQIDGCDITTIEGIGDHRKDIFHPVQEAFQNNHAIQCGFCTPGFIMATVDLVNRYQGKPMPDEATIRRELEGNICRCTGYQNIIKAVTAALAEATTA